MAFRQVPLRTPNRKISNRITSIVAQESSLLGAPVAPRQHTMGSEFQTGAIGHRSGLAHLMRIPFEVMTDVAGYLDLRSLCRMMAVNRRTSLVLNAPIIWKRVAQKLGIRLELHTSPKEEVARYVTVRRMEMAQELAVVENQYHSTNRRLEDRLREVPAFADELFHEEGRAAPNLQALVASAEGKVTIALSKVNSLASLQGSLARTIRDNKTALSHLEAALKLMQDTVTSIDRATHVSRRSASFQERILRLMFDDLHELPLVIRRGIGSFFEVELLVLQSGEQSRLAKRWMRFKRSFPIDDAWSRLKSGQCTSERDRALLALVEHMLSLSDVELLHSLRDEA